MKMLFTIVLLSAGLVSCQSRRYDGPDPALFPEKSKEYNDGFDNGFRAGFGEGLIYNILSPAYKSAF